MDVVFKGEKKSMQYDLGQKIALANVAILSGFVNVLLEYSLRANSEKLGPLEKELSLRFGRCVDDAIRSNNLEQDLHDRLVHVVAANVDVHAIPPRPILGVPALEEAQGIIQRTEEAMYKRQVDGFTFDDFYNIHSRTFTLRSAIASMARDGAALEACPVKLMLVEKAALLRTS